MSGTNSPRDIILMVAEPLTAGVVAGIATHFLIGEVGDASILGIALQPSVAVGVSVAASSLAAESIKKWVLPKAPALQSAEGILKPVLTGAVSVGVLAALTPFDMSTAPQAFAIGAGSEIGGSYLFGSVVSPLLPKSQ